MRVPSGLNAAEDRARAAAQRTEQPPVARVPQAQHAVLGGGEEPPLAAIEIGGVEDAPGIGDLERRALGVDRPDPRGAVVTGGDDPRAVARPLDGVDEIAVPSQLAARGGPPRSTRGRYRPCLE